MQQLNTQSLAHPCIHNGDSEIFEDAADVLAFRQDSANIQVIGHLLEKHKRYVFSIAFHVVKDPDIADDLVQEVFLIAIRKIHQLKDPNAFKAWICTTTKRIALNYAVRRKIVCSLNNKDGHIHVLDAIEMPLEIAEKQERIHEVQMLIDILPEFDRQIIDLFYFQGRSIKEIELELNIPNGTVKRRLHSARRRMKELINYIRPEYAETV